MHKRITMKKTIIILAIVLSSCSPQFTAVEKSNMNVGIYKEYTYETKRDFRRGIREKRKEGYYYEVIPNKMRIITYE